MQEQKREFTGVWIPKKIVEDESLNWTERALYAEVSCYEECFASNEFLAKRLGISEKRVSEIITKLKKLGYLAQTGFNGRFRILTTSRQTSEKPLGRLAKKAEADYRKTATIDNSIEKREDIYISASAEAESGDTPKKIQDIQSIWNKCSPSLLVDVDVTNTTAREKLLPKSVTVSDKAKTKLRSISVDKAKLAINNYVNDIISRNPNHDYATHRFSFHEFFTQSNGYAKFAHKDSFDL